MSCTHSVDVGTNVGALTFSSLLSFVEWCFGVKSLFCFDFDFGLPSDFFGECPWIMCLVHLDYILSHPLLLPSDTNSCGKVDHILGSTPQKPRLYKPSEVCFL